MLRIAAALMIMAAPGAFAYSAAELAAKHADKPSANDGQLRLWH